jgi:SAM-dependent methyltransferase
MDAGNTETPSKHTNQTEIFKAHEADQWYSRNKSKLQGAQYYVELDWLCHTLRPFRERIDNVLEIGCAAGHKLRKLCEELDANGEGIEPSRIAVEEGNRNGGRVKLQVGSSETLPYPDETFDLLHFGFCLYLVERKFLMRSCAEADRVLKNGGFLAITDFDPNDIRVIPYVHAAECYSYKQDYSEIFLRSGLYAHIAKFSFSHRMQSFDEDRNERISINILYKEKDCGGALAEEHFTLSRADGVT